MKSKSPSHASAKSTPKNAPSFFRTTRSLAARLLLALSLSAGLSACYVPPSSRQVTLDESTPATSYTEPAYYEASLTLTVPSGGWSIAPVEAYQLSDSENAVIWQLTPPAGPAISVISELSAAVQLPGPTHPVRHYILGKTWNWDANPELAFPKSRDALKEALADAQSLPFTSVD